MEHFFDKFVLHHEKEDREAIITSITNAVTFRGTNLWVLIFAIFVASLGLNVNSTAVIIGAMLISPLMGPIMGLGLGVGINDLLLVRKAISNYFIATGVALATSTVYFLISPLNDAHSEILARTSPTIYDVLIALFGGFAGIIATASKNKGNVIPGVAIATALMPPLCTAGYGLATLQFNYFFGAAYLYIINTVFIALATFIIVRILHVPYKHLKNERSEKIAKRIIWAVVIITLIPSLYFGYNLVQQDKFIKKANRFIANEAHFTNDYLLNKKIDAKNRHIQLVYGGNEIPQHAIEKVRSQLKKYELENTTLEIKQGFAYLSNADGQQINPDYKSVAVALDETAARQKAFEQKMDSIEAEKNLSKQIFAELRAQYPSIKSAFLQPSADVSKADSSAVDYLIVLTSNAPVSARQKKRMLSWLKVRLKRDDVILIYR